MSGIFSQNSLGLNENKFLTSDYRTTSSIPNITQPFASVLGENVLRDDLKSYVRIIIFNARLRRERIITLFVGCLQFTFRYFESSIFAQTVYYFQ